MTLIESSIFWKRLSQLHTSLNSDACWNNADIIVIPIDPASEETAFNKSSAVFTYLFGLEFPGSLVMLCEGVLNVVASIESCVVLEALQSGRPTEGPKLVLHRCVIVSCFISLVSVCFRISKEDDHHSICKVLIDMVKNNDGFKVGHLAKMRFDGILARSWDKAARMVEFGD